MIACENASHPNTGPTDEMQQETNTQPITEPDIDSNDTSELQITEMLPGQDVPDGAFYYNLDSKTFYKTIPSAPTTNDVFLYNDYVYHYIEYFNWNVRVATSNFLLNSSFNTYEQHNPNNQIYKIVPYDTIGNLFPEFDVVPLTKEYYGDILLSIANCPIENMEETYECCVNLKQSPKIPETVQCMNKTFMSCTSMTAMPELPSNVKTISFAFANCTSLVNTTKLPDGLKNANGAFLGCSQLTQAPDLPQSLIYVKSMFANCTELVEPPVLPTEICEMTAMFANCEKLRFAPSLPKKVGLYGTFKNCTSITETPDLSQCTNLQNAFAGCTSLVKINGTINVYDCHSAFSNCVNLSGSVKFNQMPWYYQYCFTNTPHDFTIIGDSETVQALQATRESVQKPIKIEDAMNHKTIHDDAVYARSDLGLSYNATAADIIPFVLDICDTMPDVILPYDIYLYEDYMYLYHPVRGGWTVLLPTTMTRLHHQIPDYEYKCKGQETYGTILESINGAPVTSMAATFQDCTEMKIAPQIPNHVTLLTYAFYNCTSLQIAPTIPDSVIDMRSSFANCYALQHVSEIPTSVAKMWNAFHRCKSLRGEIVINADFDQYAEPIEDCDKYEQCFLGTECEIWISGSCKYLKELAESSQNGNVKIKQ